MHPILAHGLSREFLQQPLIALTRQTRWAVGTIYQSIFYMMSVTIPHKNNKNTCFLIIAFELKKGTKVANPILESSKNLIK
jgi:hypothetical protein